MPCRGAPQGAAPGGGRELYCIFAVRKEDTLFVYEKQDPQYPNETGKELYGRQGGQPILLLCNGSREDTDTMVTVYCSTGRPLDWNPQLSAETGRPVPVEGVDDFSQHPTPGAVTQRSAGMSATNCHGCSGKLSSTACTSVVRSGTLPR